MSNSIIRETTLLQNQFVKLISKNSPENIEIEAHFQMQSRNGRDVFRTHDGAFVRK